jgi:NAD(P)-dependent dehydrogenase (short-subunit alcohol dehydrogenase family)
MGFAGKVVAVTGGGLGIGRATALAFGAAGARVAVVDAGREPALETAKTIEQAGGQAVALEADVSSEADVRYFMAAITDRWSGLDVLVNNAGVYYQGDAAATPLGEWNRLLAVNLTGAFLCSREAVRMMGVRGGVIVNVASEAALAGIRGQVAYNVSKAGMLALTRSMAVDGAPAIRVNCVCPGTTETPLVLAAIARSADPMAARKALETSRPLGRLGRPEEIARAILFLADDEAGYATGTILAVDGGYTAQ